MPCIGLLGNGRIAQLLDYQELLGTMMFPSDSRKRDDIVLQLVEAIRKTPPEAKIARQKWDSQMSRFSESGISLSELDHILFESLPPHLNRAKPLAKEALANFGKGLIAGQILTILIRLEDIAAADATLNRARYFAIAKLRKHVLTPNGEPRFDAPLSLRSIEDAWAQFRTVCHLYAAFVAMRDQHARDSRSGELSRQTMLGLLALAEAYRHRGQEHRSRGSLEPTLNEIEMWTVPTHIDLKDIAVTFPRVQISKADLDELKNYKHD